VDQVIIAGFSMYQSKSIAYATPKSMKGALAVLQRLIENRSVHVISTRIIRDPHEPQQKIDTFTDNGGVAVLSSDPEADMDKGFKRTSDMAKAARSAPRTRPRRSVGKEEI